MKVIINADDLGKSGKVNQSVIEMHRRGVVSSTTLMANGPDFREAADLVAQHPELGVGVHLCLDGNYHSASDYETLFDPVTKTFFDKHEVIKRIRTSSFDKEEIFREFSLQVEKVLDQGIKVSHLDTHHNLHLHFPILNQVIRVARKYGIAFIRSQRIDTSEPKSFLNQAYRFAHHVYLNMRLRSAGVYYDPAIDHNTDFHHNLNRLHRALNSKREIIEIMLHPNGNSDPETRFFSSPEVQALLSRHVIVNYHHLREVSYA